MQISSDVIGLKTTLSQVHKYQRGLNRLFKGSDSGYGTAFLDCEARDSSVPEDTQARGTESYPEPVRVR